MVIAVDLPNTGLQWQIAGGIIQRVCGMDDVELVFLQAPFLPAQAHGTQNWDAIISERVRKDLDIPQVAISPIVFDTPFLCVGISWSDAIKLVIKQFLQIGLANFAFVGTNTERLGFNCFRRQLSRVGIEPAFIPLEESETALMEIPKPCGIVTVTDDVGVELLDVCRNLGLTVPGDFHVISIGDSPKCRDCRPTLSSVVLPFNELGYRAAETCINLLKGKHVETMRISPTDLIVRDSVNLNSAHISTVAEIAQYLRSNFSYPIQMEDLVRRSSLSRRRIEQLFREAYGQSPIAYLTELRIEHAKKMLECGDAPVKQIADECGYSDPNHLSRMFKRHVGMPAGVYRDKSRQNR